MLSGCSGGAGGGSGSASTSSAVISAAQVETSKLQDAIKTDPIYKIEDSEISLLQNEGIITEADKTQLQAIQ
jgi:hypothetical protein